MRRKIISIVLCIILISITGCQSHSEKIYNTYTNNTDDEIDGRDVPSTVTPVAEKQDAVDETSGELTIYGNKSSFEWIVKAFNKEYPNIKVSFNEPDVANLSLSDALVKVSADLMSGTAGDIINITGMPYIRYGKNDLLEDLTSYMENDPDFHKEDYYTNIFNGIEFDKKLWGVPISFSYQVVRFNKTLLEENHIEPPKDDSINYKDITDIYDKIASSNDKVLISHYLDHTIFEQIEYSRFLDETKSKAYFDSQEYIDFLKEMKNIRWPSEADLRRARINYAGLDYSDRTDENDICLIVSSWYQQERNAKLFYEHPSNLTVPMLMSATNGDINFFTPDKVLSILSSSKNKEMAWKFIQFCIGEKPLEMLKDDNVWQLSGMPINRNNTLKLLEDAFGKGGEEAVQMIDKWNSKINEESIMGSSDLYTALLKISNEFYGGRKTAEECAKEVQERAEIYLKE